MVLSEQGSHTIEVINNVIHLNARGPFNQEAVTELNSEFNRCINNIEKPWAALISYYGYGIFTEEAEKDLIEIIHQRVDKGMVACATVILESVHVDLQHVQLQRIYQPSGIPFHVFGDKYNASEWLNEYLEEHRALAQSKSPQQYA